ncbi:sigma-70 family RNA polymerase sigma factor [Roseomonas sp. PWR1]|uniref:Sigma-70 family RNA polymerase sigma factor n=1 Tax=Roseomonas nitratireducens TaxID=2820810 RepID=A0ABS4AZ53_9PROT|nr:sigma-70 family RNA polymerase sigma factor [Neoroseomonas nitratireducens]MBP0466529.1 sigma-70 family RNA polymerase sigma factor [Neoroseomonas nitratireducens]
MPLDDAARAPATGRAIAAEAEPCASFSDGLVALLPRLRVQALALTRNRADADDLVQAAVTNALAAKAHFTPGSNLGAWLYRILRNRFLSDRRRARDTVELDDAPAAALSRPASQEDHLALGELRRHLARLPPDQRAALIMVSVQGLSYQDVADAMGCPVGTAKCRVFRARRQLEAWLLGTEERGRGKAAAVASGAGTTAAARLKPLAGSRLRAAT